MQLQPVSLPVFEPPSLSKDGTSKSFLNNNRSGRATVNASVQAEYLNVQKFSMEITSKDGDSVSLSFESIEYQKTLLQMSASGNEEDIGKVIDFIRKEYEDMKNSILRDFIKNMGGKVDEIDNQKELDIPEYWNAENTSQRIVDFALQFFDGFKGAGEDFLDMIKGAIEKGFQEAKEMLGNLPDSVSGLITDTYELVMQKLDAWAQEKGIGAAPDDQALLAA